MATRFDTPGWRATRWLAWSLLLVTWTVALLTPQPVRAVNAVLSQEARFPSFKLTHISAYAVLAVLTAWLPLPLRGRWLLLAVLVLHTLATEFGQHFVGRTPSWLDVGFDNFGLALGVLVSWKWWRR